MTERLPSRLLLAPDARAAERELLKEVEAAQTGDPLARVVVVVPSHRLRLHVLSLLVRGGRARLGVQVLTLRALAGTVAARAGASVGDVEAGEALFDLLVARIAAEERALSTLLAPLDDGYAGLGGSISDLLDAGFGPQHLDVATELLHAERAALGSATIDRALAILRVAARIPQELALRGAALESARIAAATEAILTDPDRALPVSRVIVHGIADATGVSSDLLRAILSRLPTTVLFPEPPDLDSIEVRERTNRFAWRFGSRLRERFEGVESDEPIPPFDPATSERGLSVRVAPDLEREIREAIDACSAAIESGVQPERIAIVARDLGPYRAALEREIDRRALPASGADGGEHPAAAVSRAWLGLLERRGEGSLDLLLAAVGPRGFGGAAGRAWELRREASKRGLLRLDEIAAATSERRGPALGQVVTPLRRAIRDLEAFARPIAPREAGERLTRLLGGAGLPVEIHERLVEPLEILSRPAAADLRLEPRELRALVSRLWSRAGERPMGSAGARDGGVALLTVTEARGLAFDHLRLIGLSRDRFPRRVRTDPFLPDPLRARLRTLLADLPVKGEGHDEERFLFAQLIVSAPLVELSTPVRDEGGRELPRSSLLDELDRAKRLVTAPAVPPAKLPAIELATTEALAGARLGDRFEQAVSESRERFDDPVVPGEIARLARQSRRLLVELSADPSDAERRDRLGPFFGFVGAAREGDRRSDAPYVTSLEALARCGWRMFLERLLRLKPPPTAEEEIPSLPPRLAGSALHLLLDRLAPAGIHGLSLPEAATGTPVVVDWPVAEIERRLEEASIDVLRAEGIDAALFAPALVRSTRELVETVRELDWSSGSRVILAVESEGSAELLVDGAVRTIRFRADRVERIGDGGPLLLTDYKSGAPVSTGKKAPTRDRALAKSIREGKNLQLAAYALAKLEDKTEAAGRLLFVRPDLAEESREVFAAAGDEALAGAPWSPIFRARELGAFLPRLVGTDLRSTFEGCESCDVRVACVQGDSGARLRYERWAARRAPGTAGGEPGAEAAARELFEVHPPKRRESGPGSGTNEAPE